MTFLPVLAGPPALRQELCSSLSLLPAASLRCLSVSQLITQRELCGFSLGGPWGPEYCKKKKWRQETTCFLSDPRLDSVHSFYLQLPRAIRSLSVIITLLEELRSLPATWHWVCFLFSVLGPCTPQVGLSVEMSSLQRKKFCSNNFERENPITRGANICEELVRFI